MSEIRNVPNDETEAEIVNALGIDFYRLGDPGTGHGEVQSSEFEAILFELSRYLRPDEVEELVELLDEAWSETVKGDSLTDFTYNGKNHLVVYTEIMNSPFSEPHEHFDTFVELVKDDIAGKFADLIIDVLVDEVVQDIPREQSIENARKRVEAQGHTLP